MPAYMMTVSRDYITDNIDREIDYKKTTREFINSN